MAKYKRLVEEGVVKKKNWKTYHLWDKKKLTTDSKWYYGDSPSEIRKRLGTYNQKEKALIPTKYDSVSEIKRYLKRARVGKKNLKRRKK